jgi:2-oxoisovalerate dehydrogenase E2 component (dihydrolipoyl transacylase)
MPDFLLPDLGEGLEEAEVIAWRVKVGDRVTIDQVIAEVETAKAVVEVPVPYSGIVATLHAEPGSTVSVGQPLITVTSDEPATEARAQESDEEASGSVLIGYGTTSAPTRTRRARRRAPTGAPPPGNAPSARSAGRSASAAPPPTAPFPAAPAPVIPAPLTADRPRRAAVISPLVRKEARDAGLDLATLTGNRPAGVVSRRDVREAIAGLARLEQAPPGRAATSTGTGERRIPLRGARRAVADKLSRSRREIPEATVWVDVDATGLIETRRALNAADPGRPVSLLALLARFTVLGLRRYPELNARIEQDEIIIPERVNLGFAAQTDHGLVVPVVPDAHLLTTRDLSARLAERTAAARERRLAPADLSGGTFTVNNYGVFGVDGSAAIINHPEVAILGMGRVIDRPWAAEGQLTVRKVTELTLAFDHRACDGGTAGGFLRYVADCVESPATALGDM